MKHEPVRAVRQIDLLGQSVARFDAQRLEDAMLRLPYSWSDKERREYARRRM